MHPAAFILARPYDLPIARACADALAAQAWQPHILLDPREWSDFPPGAIPAHYWTGGRGMFGNDCAAAILAAILTHSAPGQIVAKFDCDVRLTDPASAWLAAAPSARCLTLAGRYCGTFWAAPRDQVQSASAWLASAPVCRCPESGLITKALRHTPPGLEHHPVLTCEKWIPPRPWPATAGALTLPSISRNPNRLIAAAALFGQVISGQ